MGADGKSAEIGVNPPLTIEPDTDNAGVGRQIGNHTAILRVVLFFLKFFMPSMTAEGEKLWKTENPKSKRLSYVAFW